MHPIEKRMGSKLSWGVYQWSSTDDYCYDIEYFHRYYHSCPAYTDATSRTIAVEGKNYSRCSDEHWLCVSSCPLQSVSDAFRGLSSWYYYVSRAVVASIVRTYYMWVCVVQSYDISCKWTWYASPWLFLFSQLTHNPINYRVGIWHLALEHPRDQSLSNMRLSAYTTPFIPPHSRGRNALDFLGKGQRKVRDVCLGRVRDVEEGLWSVADQADDDYRGWRGVWAW